MLAPKYRQTFSTAAFVTLGALYFGAFGSLNLNPLLKQQLLLLPVQIGVLVYLLWWRPKRQQK